MASFGCLCLFVRFNESIIVLNSMANSEWRDEIRIPNKSMCFEAGMEFKIIIR